VSSDIIPQIVDTSYIPLAFSDYSVVQIDFCTFQDPQIGQLDPRIYTSDLTKRWIGQGQLPDEEVKQ